MAKVEAFREITISGHHAGFGMYQLGEANGDAWASVSDLIQEIADSGITFLPLEEALSDHDFIAAGVKNICGKIYGGDPDSIFATLDETPDGQAEVNYFGIIEIKVDADQWD